MQRLSAPGRSRTFSYLTQGEECKNGRVPIDPPQPRFSIYFQACPCISYTAGKCDGSGPGDDRHYLGKKINKRTHITVPCTIGIPLCEQLMLTVDTAVLQALGWKAQHIRLPGYRERALKARLSTFLVPAEASGSLFPEQGYWCWAQVRAG